MSMNILRATKLKYGAIHSADPKQMCGYSSDYYIDVRIIILCSISEGIEIVGGEDFFADVIRVKYLFMVVFLKCFVFLSLINK